MGTILGDMFKNVSNGLGDIFNGDVFKGLGGVIGGVLDGAGRTVNGALNLVGLGDEDEDGDIEPQTLYILDLLAMLSKMAKADGCISRDETQFLNSVLDELGYEDEVKQSLQKFCNEQKANVGEIFDCAARVVHSAVAMSPQDEGLNLRIGAYRYLFLMALADGKLDDNEIALLRTLPEHLGLKNEAFEFMADELLGVEDDASSADAAIRAAYATLGISPDASDSEVRAAWRRKMGAFHPDMIQGKDLSPEWLELANQKSAEINQAYETIKMARGL